MASMRDELQVALAENLLRIVVLVGSQMGQTLPMLADPKRRRDIARRVDAGFKDWQRRGRNNLETNGRTAELHALFHERVLLARQLDALTGGDATPLDRAAVAASDGPIRRH
jgi:hypothetical protein